LCAASRPANADGNPDATIKMTGKFSVSSTSLVAPIKSTPTAEREPKQ
jgi:hypothetical protein